MSVLKKLTKKVENSKIVKNPKFLVIGLIIIVAIITLIYFIFLKYSPIMNFKYEGYAISGKEITENLLGSSAENDSSTSKNIELTKIEEQGTIFKKLNDYFVGSKEKTEINLNYPIYINGNSSLYNLSEGSTLISKNFEEISSYPNLSISEGKIYDGNNLERADAKEYIFVKTTDNIYINLYEIKIKTTANEYTIPVNSIIAFAENSIRYYSVNNNVLVFNQINDIDNNSNVQIVENSYTYKELLTKLGILQEESNNQENTNSQENIIEENTASEDIKDDNETNNNEQQNTDNNTPDQNGYIKPEVRAENFTAEVYTAKSTLHIKDPAGRIVEAPTFEIYKDGKIYLRRTFSNSGEIQITGLIPDTEYEIIGKYIYLNENNQKVENTFYEGRFTTKGYEELESIDITKENGEKFSNKIQLTKVKITSDLNAEVLKGVNQVEIETGEIRTVLKNGQVNELLQGKEITIESSEGLKSDSEINYVIKFYDNNGVELKVNNNEGETRTSKEAPTVRVSLKEQDIVNVTLGLKLTNRDNVELENYKYVVTRPNGEIVQEKKLVENETGLLLEDLDQNQYYKISIYVDYDLNDNKGKQEQVEIGNLVFATQPISTLGSLELTVENKELTSTTSMISYKINEDRTDKRLIQILNELTINIKDGENIVKTDTLTEEEITNLQQAGTKEIKCENLKSNTTYTIEITGNVQLGNTQESIQVTYNYKEFTTLKIPAKVEIRNQFVTGNLIDFDIRIEDINNSVLNNKVRMELRNSSDDLIDLQEITTNEDYIRKTYEKLEENQTYKLSFYADQYNEGSTDATYKVNYLIQEIEIVTEPGISGNIGLTELTRKATGKNLVDMSSEIKWYVYPNFNTSDYYGKEYNEETKTLTLGGHNNTRRAVYDLREYAGQEVTMSFKAKAVSGSQTAYIQNSKTDTNRTKIEGLTEEWKEYQYTLTVDGTGYLGFYIAGGNGIEVQELQIELGNRKTPYEEFKYTLQSNYSVNLEDRRDEITTNDYYIKIYEENDLVKTYRYEEISEENIITNAIKTYETQAGKQYKVELAIKIRDREYVLSELEYNTKDTEEIRGIYNKDDFLEIQPRGYYIVLGDIDLSEGTGYQYRFGNSNLPFEGVIDFNGKNLIFTNQLSNVFEKTSDSAIIKNIVINLYLKSSAGNSGIIYKNYGTLENIMINVYDIYNYYKSDQNFITQQNYGIINKCIINLKEVLKVRNKVTSVFYNYGKIKNTYITGNKIDASEKIESENWKDTAGICMFNNERGTIENIYSTIDVELGEGSYTRNAMPLVSHNYGDYVKNVYSTGNIINGDKTRGINVYNNYGSYSKTENSYYMSDDIYNATYDRKTTKLALYDSDFQNNILNAEQAFEVEENIQNGYYPKLILSDCMPKQEYIKLPEVTDADLPDIIYSEILEQTSSTAKVKLRVHNPSAETITNIKIKNANCIILDQEYNEGQSTVIVELNNPTYFTSSYEVISISTKGAFNKEYTRKYDNGERILNIDLYKEIKTIDEWNEINKSIAENYILMNDLDFINNGDKAKITGVYTGKIKGNGYTIKNIQITSGNIFYSISNTGKIENLYISNYQAIGNFVGGVINTLNGEIDNIHVTNEKIQKNADSQDNQQGGLVDLNYGNIYNCSVNNLEIKNYSLSTVTRVGGLVGIAPSGNIENSYVYNLNMDVKENLSYDGVGGLIGNIQGKTTNVLNCYVAGNIYTDTSVGGIVGNQYSGSIKKCYSLVNIYTESDLAAGIVGRSNSSLKVESNLFLGKIYSNAENSMADAICSSTEFNNNYIYENVTINGLFIENVKNIVTKEELKNQKTYLEKIKLGNEFDYESISDGELPLLNNKDTKQNLPNQTRIKLKEKTSIYIEEIMSEKSNVNELTASITVNNEENKEIVDLKIENMQIISKNIIPRNGKTYITISAMPTKYYDSYKINEIIYLENGKEKSIEADGKIEIKFYKELYTVADWQDIEIGTYQNYKLMNDIDFRNINNIKYDVTMKELSTNNNEKYTLKNITLNTTERNSGLIKKVDEIENITFENISLTTIANYRIGVIVANDLINNCIFRNIEINAENAELVGCIAVSNKITNIELNQIDIKGSNYVGGLIGKVSKPIDTINYNNVNIYGKDYVGGVIGWTNSTVNNITANENINVEGRNWIGGIAGYALSSNHDSIHKAQLEDVDIKGNEKIGGIVGEGNVYECEVKNSNVEGTNYIGGIAGNLANSQDLGNIVIDSIIKGNKYVGGIAGNSSDAHTTNNQVKNATIIGTNYIGGIVGFFGRYTDLRFNAISDSNIEATGDYVGGIVGKTETTIFSNYCINTYIKGVNNVGGIVGEVARGSIYNNYTNARIEGISKIGGLIGFLNNERMEDELYVMSMFRNYSADAKIKGNTMIGGLVGGIFKILESEEYYYSNFAQAKIISSDQDKVSLGIGSNPQENLKLKDTYYYKYSNINGENPSRENEIFISGERYLDENDLKQQATYTSKLKWSINDWNFSTLVNNRYPILTTQNLPEQEGIYLPIDEDNLVNSDMNEINTNSLEEEKEQQKQKFQYNNKTIQTFSTYSLIVAEDGSKATRNTKLYVKDNTLYAIPAVLASTSENEKITPVADNLIIDSFNGKEYETVLGSDGKLYDLKEPIAYPENFVNSDIESIGNNLNSDFHEVEVSYKNGNKIKFNYQTGEIISSSEADDAEKIGLFDYLKEKISEIGNSNSEVSQEIKTKYEASKELQTKLEETSVEEAIEKQNTSELEEGIEGVTITENNVTNNSLTENKYISVYDEEIDDYLIYNEEELLDTTKEEVVSENEKIKANNLNEYYESEGETKNTKLGIVWIVIIIIGVGITLFVLGKKIGIRGRC